MFVLMRAVTYASIFVGLVLVYLPARLLSWSGIVRPASIGILQIGGAVISLTGAVLALWCVVAFAVIGRGTPAPFDAPRRLVIRGPYRFVRNPMYWGALLILIGATLFYRSLVMSGFTVFFILAAHLFVIWYEEPVLQKKFGAEYEIYCRKTKRWWPRVYK